MQGVEGEKIMTIVVRNPLVAGDRNANLTSLKKKWEFMASCVWESQSTCRYLKPRIQTVFMGFLLLVSLLVSPWLHSWLENEAIPVQREHLFWKPAEKAWKELFFDDMISLAFTCLFCGWSCGERKMMGSCGLVVREEVGEDVPGNQKPWPFPQPCRNKAPPGRTRGSSVTDVPGWEDHGFSSCFQWQ